MLACVLAVGLAPIHSVAASEPAALPKVALPDAFDDPDDVPMPDLDLWQRIRVGFLMDPLETPLVHEQENWYSSRPDYINRFVGRGSLYLHYIVEQVEKRKMPTEVALLPVIESAFTPKAYSRAKASGLWQFIPSTGKNYGLTQDWWRDNRNDVMKATDAALNYLQKLHDQFGSWELAFAAYNCGEGCVARAIAYNAKRGLPTDYLNLKLPPETRNYVPKLIAVKNIVLSPTMYGIEIDSIPNTPYFTTVEAPQRIDMKVAAKLAGMSDEEFRALNPAHNKPVASAGTLVVPLDKAETFRTNLEAYDQPLVSWTTYNARRGESMDTIARHHGTSLIQLRAANDTLRLDKRNRLRAPGIVMVPMRQASGKPVLPPSSSGVTRVASTVTLPTAPAAVAPARAAAVAATTHASKTYVVRSGDTLYSIARRYNTGYETLMKLNRFSAKTVLQPGMKVRVP